MNYFKGIGKKSGSYTGRKLPLSGLLTNKKHTIFNEYTVGSGVGASSIVTRRLKKQRARIKKCTRPTPIYPELDENEYLKISDDIINFNSALEEQVNALPSGTIIDLGDTSNNIVDVGVYTTKSKSLIKEVSTSTTISSLTFTTISKENIVNSAVNNNDDASNINDLLSSNTYNVVTSEPIINLSDNVNDENISLYTTHTFINTGTTTDGIPNIEYIMSITEFIPLD